MESLFAMYMATTGDRIYAATRAGYSSPQQSASQNVANPTVQNAMRAHARALLQNEGAQIGVAVLIEIASDKLQKASSRVAAAKSLVQLSGVAGAQDLNEKDLTEMSADDIRDLLARARDALQERLAQRNTIEHNPGERPIAPAESPQIAQAAPNAGVFD